MGAHVRRRRLHSTTCRRVTPSLPHTCSGFTGADLANLMNEAAILAARRSLSEISKVGGATLLGSARGRTPCQPVVAPRA